MLKIKIFIVFLIVLTTITSCEFKSNNQSIDPLLKNELKDINNGRSVWQKPGLVIDKLGDISGKTIADIGAGTGYFSFRMAFKAEKVIAIDIDAEMIQLIEAFKTNLPKEMQGKIETRLSLSNDPLLSEKEVDIVFIMNTLAYIEKPLEYLKLLYPSIDNNGKLVIVDFKTEKMPISAPPMDERIELSKVLRLLEAAGYKDVEVDTNSLDYQYMISAAKASE